MCIDCPCPNVYLEDIPSEDCPFDIKQIQKIIFQRKYLMPADPHLLSSWLPLLTANNDSKIVVSPFIGGEPIIVAGEAITNGGGDNTTISGIEEILGTNPSKFSCNFKSLTPEQEIALKLLKCEKELTVYFINQKGEIIYNKDGDLKSKGFYIYSLFVSDKDVRGFGTKNKTFLSFYLKPCWSKEIAILKPEFNPLKDLIPIDGDFQFNNDEYFQFNNNEYFELNN